MTSALEMSLLRRQNLGDGLRRSARSAPDKPAIIFHTVDGASRTVSFAQLNGMVNAVANNLIKRGIAKDDKVASLSRNSIEFLVLGYALHKIGAWLVPVNFMLQPSEVRHLIDFSEAKWFFVEDALVGNMRSIAGELGGVRQFVQFGAAGALAPGWMAFDELLPGPTSEPEVVIDTEDVATLLFTSGTESAPKGVLSTHANYYAAQLSWALNMGIGQDDIFLLSIPLIHMAGYMLSTLCLTNHATIVMTQSPQPVQMIDLIDRHQITAMALPPTLYVAMVSSPNFKTCNLNSVRTLLTWASTIPRAMVDGWKQVAPTARFYSGQGMSETTAAVLTGGFAANWDEMPNGDGRWVGRAVSYAADVRLVDDDDNDVPVGEPGEQIIRGPVIMKGYYKNEETNQRAFRGGWFHTGDILFRDAAGNYFFADRKKDMIKSGGENVYCQEVESVLGTHPAVMQCAVFGLPDERWGEAVVAAMIPRAGNETTEAELIEYCRSRLAGFQTPKRIFFRTSMPISAANKLLKRELKAEYAKIVQAG